MKTFKKALSLILSIMFILSCFTLAFAEEKEVTGEVDAYFDSYPVFMKDQCTLTVNGKKVNEYSEYVKIYYGKDESGNVSWSQAQIPFITVIESLGGKVFWLGSDKAVILCRFNLFLLDIDKIILLTSNPKAYVFSPIFINLFRPLMGTSYVFEYLPLEKEVIIDDVYTFKGAAAVLGLQTEIDVDNAEISIYG